MNRWTTGALSCLAVVALVAPHAQADPNRERDEDMTIELGRRLFFDPTVSRSGTIACSACHDPAHSFSDPRPISVDEDFVKLPRRSQTLLDLPAGRLHWDGEFDDMSQLLASRISLPEASRRLSTERFVRRFKEAESAPDGDERLSDPMERAKVLSEFSGPSEPSPSPASSAASSSSRSVSPQAGSPRRAAASSYRGKRRSEEPGEPQLTPEADAARASRTDVVARLAQDARYARGFQLAFGSRKITEDRLFAALEAYTLSLRSTQSPYDRYLEGDYAAMSVEARRGLMVFDAKARCSTCHTLRGGRAVSDDAFHDTGIADGTEMGRGDITLMHGDRHKFRTPNLRDVAKRAPYMHDGSLATLEDVVRYYTEAKARDPRRNAEIVSLGLTDTEVGDVVAFLEALSGEERPGIGDEPSYRGEGSVIRVVDHEGIPLEGVDVRVTPFGDVLRRAGEPLGALPAPQTVTTDARGRIRFTFPAATHVVLDSKRYEIGLRRPLPDSVRRQTLVATPKNRVSMRVWPVPGEPVAEELVIRFTPQPKRGAPRGRKRAEEFPLTLRYYAQFPGGELFYMADRPAARSRAVAAISAGAGGLPGLFAVDLRGGASDPVDLARLRLPSPKTADQQLAELTRRVQ